MNQKLMIVRLGAYGDMVIISPVIDWYFKQGWEIVLYTGKRGEEIYKEDERIQDIVLHDEKTPLDKLDGVIEQAKQRIKPDKMFNLTASIEQLLALHPSQPEYVYSKEERRIICDKNYYENTLKLCEIDIATISDEQKRPSLRFTEEEIENARKHLKPNAFNVLWVISGSARNKVYPWSEHVWTALIEKHDDINIITVGDERCQILEDFTSSLPEKNLTLLSGKVGIRESFILAQIVDLVVSPDTGALHSAGCVDVPKIALLGHTTKENITRTFLNDYSLEADCECAPCFYLIYDHTIQCPIEEVTGASWCMGVGLQSKRVFDHVNKVIETLKVNKVQNA